MSYSVFPEVLFLLGFSSVFLWLNTKFKSRKALRMLWLCVLILYIGILVWVVLISRGGGNAKYTLNLIPLSSYRFVVKVYNSFDVFKQIVDNVLVFIPLGILLPAVCNAGYTKKSCALIVLAGLTASLAIEVPQYVFSMGFSEVDDLINNTWGCAIGCGIYALSCRTEAGKDRTVLEKGWFKCLLPLIMFIAVIGTIWCYREFILLGK